MYQIAQICTYIFKKFLGVTPPNHHNWGAASPSPDPSPWVRVHRPIFQGFSGRWCACCWLSNKQKGTQPTESPVPAIFKSLLERTSLTWNNSGSGWFIQKLQVIVLYAQFILNLAQHKLFHYLPTCTFVFHSCDQSVCLIAVGKDSYHLRQLLLLLLL